MQTRCPQCQTIAPLEADRPKGDTFTCASCGASFDAYAHLTEAASSVDAAKVTSTHPMTPDAYDEQGELFRRPRPAAVPTPRFARTRQRSARPSQWRWWLASVVLLALLLGVYPIANRKELARDASWRPTLQSICDTVRCQLPPWSEPGKFQVTARDVRPHPSAKGALLITVSFRNTAQFEQAWPLLELTTSDLNGREVGLRRFRAPEYLGGPPESPLIAPGQSANATLEVVDPGRDVVSWNFEFR